jgi:hypothetical protein
MTISLVCAARKIMSLCPKIRNRVERLSQKKRKSTMMASTRELLCEMRRASLRALNGKSSARECVLGRNARV